MPEINWLTVFGCDVPNTKQPALRLTRGEYETSEGRADRSFMPESKLSCLTTISIKCETMILGTVRVVYETEGRN